jgi:hypothetical protein
MTAAENWSTDSQIDGLELNRKLRIKLDDNDNSAQTIVHQIRAYMQAEHFGSLPSGLRPRWLRTSLCFDWGNNGRPSLNCCLLKACLMIIGQRKVQNCKELYFCETRSSSKQKFKIRIFHLKDLGFSGGKLKTAFVLIIQQSTSRKVIEKWREQNCKDGMWRTRDNDWYARQKVKTVPWHEKIWCETKPNFRMKNLIMFPEMAKNSLFARPKVIIVSFQKTDRRDFGKNPAREWSW